MLMPHSFSYAVSMNLEHSIKEGSHERYPDHFQCFRNIKKIKYPDFQAMTIARIYVITLKLNKKLMLIGFMLVDLNRQEMTELRDQINS